MYRVMAFLVHVSTKGVIPKKQKRREMYKLRLMSMLGIGALFDDKVTKLIKPTKQSNVFNGKSDRESFTKGKRSKSLKIRSNRRKRLKNKI